jgi:hypothetical protein
MPLDQAKLDEFVAKMLNPLSPRDSDAVQSSP